MYMYTYTYICMYACASVCHCLSVFLSVRPSVGRSVWLGRSAGSCCPSCRHVGMLRTCKHTYTHAYIHTYIHTCTQQLAYIGFLYGQRVDYVVRLKTFKLFRVECQSLYTRAALARCEPQFVTEALSKERRGLPTDRASSWISKQTLAYFHSLHLPTQSRPGKWVHTTAFALRQRRRKHTNGYLLAPQLQLGGENSFQHVVI